MSYSVQIGNNIHTADIDAFYPLIDFYTYNAQDWENIRNKSSFIVQVLDNQKTIGWGRCVDDGSFCMLYDIAVHPDYQKKGIGTMIINEIKKYISKHSFISVSLFYNPDNPTVKEFYKKCGFYELPNAMRLKK
ncbi:MAG: GNAT family N-acetyltransferase [Alphaproteobacteria bacterium]|nr:GNAT family N-acetyltransferase [Alphaproteobacteria bacterium]